MPALPWLLSLLLPVLSAAPSAGTPEALFEQAVQDGTLFESETAQRFQQGGWGRDYYRLVKERWKGQRPRGLTLELRPIPNGYSVGQSFDAGASLNNGGPAVSPLLDTGGDCGMTHPLRIVVVEPDGRLIQGVGGGAVGGPHCFCHPEQRRLEPGGSVELMTGFASRSAVRWVLERAGDLLVVGSYSLFEAGVESRVYSAPLEVSVRER